MNKWIFAILVIALASCGTQRQIKKCEKCFELLPPATTKIKDSVNITYDTVPYYVSVPKDSVIGRYVIVCDSNGKASIKSSDVKKGNRSNLETTLKDNELNIKATCEAYEDSVKLLNKTILRLRSETNTVYVPKLVEAKLTWWQKIKIRFGGWAFLIIAIYITYKTLKTYYKVNTPMGLILTLRRKLLR